MRQHIYFSPRLTLNVPWPVKWPVVNFWLENSYKMLSLFHIWLHDFFTINFTSFIYILYLYFYLLNLINSVWPSVIYHNRSFDQEKYLLPHKSIGFENLMRIHILRIIWVCGILLQRLLRSKLNQKNSCELKFQ